LREFDCRYNELKEPLKSRSEEGLSKFLEFLREEEERIRKEEIERLKPVGVENGAYLEYRLKVRSGGGRGCSPLNISGLLAPQLLRAEERALCRLTRCAADSGASRPRVGA
jgi:hypothetical protein